MLLTAERQDDITHVSLAMYCVWEQSENAESSHDFLVIPMFANQAKALSLLMRRIIKQGFFSVHELNA